jgi:hypothetical protein
MSGEYKRKKLPFVFPILILQGERAKFVPLSDVLLKITCKISKFIPTLNPIIIDLSEFTEEEIEKGWPYTYPVEIMKEYRNEDIVNIFASIHKKVQDHEYFKVENLSSDLGSSLEYTKSYIVSLKKGRTIQEVNDAIQQHAGGESMTFSQLSWKLFGKDSLYLAREQGREEGRKMAVEASFQKGRQEGLQDYLIRSVSRRFAPPSKTLRNKISRIEKPVVLENLLDAVGTQGDLKSIENMVDAALQQQKKKA